MSGRDYHFVEALQGKFWVTVWSEKAAGLKAAASLAIAAAMIVIIAATSRRERLQTT